MARKQPDKTVGWQWAVVVAVVLAAGGGWVWWSQVRQPAETVAVRLRSLTPAQAAGQAAFRATCAACHGANAGGTDAGPPLIHRIYEPGHHPDASFAAAVQRGVRQHHWRFGDMPPQPQVTADDLQAIVGFVRAVQRANAIE